MKTLRVVSVLTVVDIAAERRRFERILGLAVVMDHGWIATLADDTGRHQLSLLTVDATAPCNPAVSVEVDDVDEAYRQALDSSVRIVHPLQTESWGVRRFFFEDAAGNIVNVLQHS